MSVHHAPTKQHKPVVLTDIKKTIPSKKLEAIGKSYLASTYKTHKAIHAKCSGNPVLAFPMHTGDYHCVRYTTYPKEPRFINATLTPKQTRLGLLGHTEPIGDKVFLVEGLWDMLTMSEDGLPARGLPGVNNFDNEWIELFDGKTVYILFDNDKPDKRGRRAGEFYANKHAMKLYERAKEVKILELPHGIKDVSDLYKATGSRKEVRKIINKLIRDASIFKPPDPRDEIREVILGKGNSQSKSMVITAIIIKDIEAGGGKVIPFNKDQEFALVVKGVDIYTDENINVHLSRYYDFVPSDGMWRQVWDRLYNHAVKAEGVRVFLCSTYQDNACYIGFKRKGIIKITPEDVITCPQGTDGIYVKSPSSYPLDLPDVKGRISSIDDILNMFWYDGSPDCQRFLIKAWFYFTFFKSSMRTALCITGDHGSGKTFLQKILKGVLFGFDNEKYMPNKMPEEDHAYILMTKESKYLFLDEVNENKTEMKSRLRTLITGEETVFRPKYSRKNIRFHPELWLSLSSYSPRFRDPDIAQRLCIIKLAAPDEKKLIHEHEFFKTICRKTIWKSIMKELHSILVNFTKPKERIPLVNYCRQVEMANFAWQAFPKDKELCLKTFNTLGEIQTNFSGEFDPVFDLIETYLINNPYTKNGHVTLTIRQIHEGLRGYAKQANIKSLPVSHMSMAQWLTRRSRQLETRFNFKTKQDPIRNARLYVFKVPEGAEDEF